MNKKQLLSPTLICLLPALVGAFLYDKLPEQLPIHWNVAGEIDNYGHKALVLFGFPIFFMMAELFMYASITTDPMKQNQSPKVKTLCLWLLPVTLLVVYSITVSVAMGYEVNVGGIICLFLGVIFVIIGNYLPKGRQNYTIGYRIPWTLNDAENWNKTHRLAGYLWIVGGLVLIVSALLVHDTVVLAGVTVGLLILCVVPVLYSVILYRKKNNTCNQKEDE